MLKVALLSRWHVHADDYAREAKENPNIFISAIWDEDAERGRKWADELEVLFIEDIDTLLADSSIDAVIVAAPTAMHHQIIVKAAKAGKHIFSEKVLALSFQESKDIFSSVKESNVQLMLSLPRLVETPYLYASEAIEKGLLGKVNTVRCRCAHGLGLPSETEPYGWLPEHFFNEEQTGGGAFIDLGAHPIYIVNRLAGKPKAVTARLEAFYDRSVDDNAIAIVEYETGILGICETSFISLHTPFIKLEVYGSEGTLLIEDDSIRIKSSKLDPYEWVIPEHVPAKGKMPMEQWVDAILNHTVPSITDEDAFLLTQINEAAAKSHRTGERVLI
ncbi:Gfo/Idh/MocA family protein [Heyndrickxia acidicola]|uniref:Gfo/Idh/MocA family oxidoreductase n=1 Tax=Heyndrickxia acidicola TaxID=209389 RepID=A0ABU6MHW2_9BACI|nr:Gfo/Idh/MocA family oxidoreductase [Heyndrickxia acidicola]MED1203988.1 Gfo/Idh/MocA family oxidoreductase [Heyndrickxia acidicola]